MTVCAILRVASADSENNKIRPRGRTERCVVYWRLDETRAFQPRQSDRRVLPSLGSMGNTAGHPHPIVGVLLGLWRASRFHARQR